MEVLKAIEDRRSIRMFQSDEPSKDMIEDILNCGRLAPSAKNRQPWYFVIVRNELKDKIADLMICYTLNHGDMIERTKIGCPSSVNPTANVIKQAPILVLIFKEKDDNWIVGDNLSIGACIENICLRATDLGLGSLWIRDTVYVAEKIADLVNHSDMELNCAVALGYANQTPKQRPRKNLDDIVEWIE